MPKNRDFHLLIIHYNNPGAIARSLKLFLDHCVPADRIYVFDNGSCQDDVVKLSQLGLDYKINIIYSKENLGWGGAINRFIRSRSWLDSDLLAVSAHDTILEKADWSVLDEVFADQSVLFLCPQYLAPVRCKYSVARGFRCRPSDGGGRTETLVGHATLCFTRPSVIAGLSYDENCFIYGCELEIFLRASDSGYKTIITDRIVVENPGTDSSSEFCILAFNINSVYIARLRRGLPGYIMRMLVIAASALRLAFQGKSAEAVAKFKGLRFSLRTGGAGFRECLRLKN